jgi:hypothetical protein
MTNFLSRGNKPYAVHAGEDTDNDWVIIPKSYISNVHSNVKVPIYGWLTSDGTGNYTIDKGIITRKELSNPPSWEIDVNKISEFSRIYVRKLGALNNNPVTIPDPINPLFTTFISTAIEIERTKNNPAWVKFDSNR